MNPANIEIASLDASRERDLLRLEIQVARRADKLRRMGACRGGRDLIHWLKAEEEVLEGYFEAEEMRRKVTRLAPQV